MDVLFAFFMISTTIAADELSSKRLSFWWPTIHANTFTTMIKWRQHQSPTVVRKTTLPAYIPNSQLFDFENECVDIKFSISIRLPSVIVFPMRSSETWLAIRRWKLVFWLTLVEFLLHQSLVYASYLWGLPMLGTPYDAGLAEWVKS